MNPRIGLSVAVALFVGLLAVRTQDTRAEEKPFDDTEFVKMAASCGIHEVELGKLAATRAKNEDVKKFGQKLADDHGKLNEELRTAAKAANIPVPDKMVEKDQKEFDRLKDIKGDDFDKEFIKHIVKTHEEAVTQCTRASKEAKNAELKACATKALPTIKAHLEAAKKLQEQIK